MGPEPMIQASKKKEAFLCDVILHHQKKRYIRNAG